MKGEGVKILKTEFITDSKVISLSEALKPSSLEEDYVNAYGKEFVDDLKKAYYWARKEVRRQEIRKNLSFDDIVERRRKTPHEIGDRKTVFFVDFRHEELYTMTIDEFGDKTLFDYGPCPSHLNVHEKGYNVKYLLSGMFCYDVDKTKKYLDKFLGEGSKFWYRSV